MFWIEPREESLIEIINPITQSCDNSDDKKLKKDEGEKE